MSRPAKYDRLLCEVDRWVEGIDEVLGKPSILDRVFPEDQFDDPETPWSPSPLCQCDKIKRNGYKVPECVAAMPTDDPFFTGVNTHHMSRAFRVNFKLATIEEIETLLPTSYAAVFSDHKFQKFLHVLEYRKENPLDPDATVEVMLDASRPLIERHDAAVALSEWIGHGGFLPDGMTEEEVADAINEVAKEYNDEAFNAS